MSQTSITPAERTRRNEAARVAAGGLKATMVFSPAARAAIEGMQAIRGLDRKSTIEAVMIEAWEAARK